MTTNNTKSQEIIPAAALKGLSFAELFALHSALKTLSEVLNGFVGQPRFVKGEHELNAAGEILDDHLQLVNFAIDAVYDEAEARPLVADDANERDKRFGLLAGRYVDGLTDPAYALAHLAPLTIGRAAAKKWEAGS